MIDTATTTVTQDFVEPSTTVSFSVSPSGPGGAARGVGRIAGVRGTEVSTAEVTLVNDLAWAAYSGAADGSLTAEAHGRFTGDQVRLTVLGHVFTIDRAAVPSFHVPTVVAILAAIAPKPAPAGANA